MPMAPPRPCTKPGCHEYATKRGRCDAHQPEPWAGRGPGSSRGYGSKWQRIRERILRRDGYLCQPCLSVGNITEASQVDHITHKAAGGTDRDDNLQAICTTCHREKTLREAQRGIGGISN